MSLVFLTSIIFQLLVSRCLFTQITDLIGESSLNLWLGKTGLKLVGVLIALNFVVYGSCISSMSNLLLILSLIISRCALSDLFKLICNILIFVGWTSGFAGSACCSGIGVCGVGVGGAGDAAVVVVVGRGGCVAGLG